MNYASDSLRNPAQIGNLTPMRDPSKEAPRLSLSSRPWYQALYAKLRELKSMTEINNLESQIFAKIVRHIVERIDELDMVHIPGDSEQAITLLNEIAEAFERDGGFEYTAEQALPLAQTFASLTSSMRSLSYQATDLGSEDAAGKIKWAAAKAHSITADLEERHLGGAGGTVTIRADDEEILWDDERAGHS